MTVRSYIRTYCTYKVKLFLPLYSRSCLPPPFPAFLLCHLAARSFRRSSSIHPSTFSSVNPSAPSPPTRSLNSPHLLRLEQGHHGRFVGSDPPDDLRRRRPHSFSSLAEGAHSNEPSRPWLVSDSVAVVVVVVVLPWRPLDARLRRKLLQHRLDFVPVTDVGACASGLSGSRCQRPSHALVRTHALDASGRLLAARCSSLTVAGSSSFSCCSRLSSSPPCLTVCRSYVVVVVSSPPPPVKVGDGAGAKPVAAKTVVPHHHHPYRPLRDGVVLCHGDRRRLLLRAGRQP